MAMSTPLKDARILLGVTGSIACYKAADLASKLHQAGSLVDVILTGSAERFITPLTFQSVTGRMAYTDADLWGAQGHVLHIGLARETDLLVIAPITANTMAKLSHGAADNLLSLTALAVSCPLLIAPAMDGGMYSHPATQANIKILEGRQVEIAGPAQGHLASGQAGVGRMLEPEHIFGRIRQILAQGGALEGRKITISAGPTQEPFDPVRFISNHSSGKQGFALAQAGLDFGAQVTLISGPVDLQTPQGAHRVNVQTASEMLEAVMNSLPDCDALVMAAAVGDFSPADYSQDKIKKGLSTTEIRLKNTPDILAEVANYKDRYRRPLVTIGFAAESQDLLANARGKLTAKKLDMIVANDITSEGSGFKGETNDVLLVYPDGSSQDLPLMSKTEVSETVMQNIAEILGNQAD
jgi:phosphopantothenoylcysteine decarboxylase/phosphopantothenate--cysteine ligase